MICSLTVVSDDNTGRGLICSSDTVQCSRVEWVGCSELTTQLYGFMVYHMKTTVEIPDDLFIEAKKRAAELRRPLKSLIEAGLRAQLEATDPARERPARRIQWVTVEGGLPPELDLSDRESVSEWIRKERTRG